ncbi:ankyrin repeat domain-containing protein [Rhodoferax sp.]|uniref:ankyrin repeat domain-containing protein n=1 Tax=Rhodoferax sp. TaxID=50421 RepID=UPI00283C86BC|nr:ankyrin repeat domain-containing protein [Rhodoferax sp.]MDR3371785.1 ankyrin repeat domain-containing protein [Rhodoferax sp.]
MSTSFLKLNNCFKNVFYCIVLIGFSAVYAGSYDDFFTAIRQDDAAEVTALLQRGFDPNTVDAAGVYGLISAIKLESLNVAEVLIQWPQTNVEVRNAADESPLMLAALAGNVKMCRMLIDKDADVNKTGWTPLHYAATNGHLEVIRMLLDESAYIDATSPNGTTPLMMAARYGTPEAVQLLLEAGADPSLKNDLGLSALDFANRATRGDAAQIISAFVRGQQPKGTW